nr:MAG TPA: hypothetical protein [Caudoviricetes sp.]
MIKENYLLLFLFSFSDNFLYFFLDMLLNMGYISIVRRR